MKCKSKYCDLEIRHAGGCKRVVNTPQDVVNKQAGNGRQMVGCEVGERLEEDSNDRSKVGRQTAWQQANRERYNTKMREYMRGRRAGRGLTPGRRAGKPQ